MVCLLSGLGCSGKKREPGPVLPPDGVSIDVTVPLTLQQAAAVNGIRGAKGESGVVANLSVDGQGIRGAATEGIRGGIRGGVRGGIRGGRRGGVQEGIRGGPKRGDPDVPAIEEVGYVVSFILEEPLPEGEHQFDVRLFPERSPNKSEGYEGVQLILASVRASVPGANPHTNSSRRPDVGTSSFLSSSPHGGRSDSGSAKRYAEQRAERGGAEGEPPFNTPLPRHQVLQPDTDEDGVTDLVETALQFKGRTADPTHPGIQPTEEDVRATFAELGAELVETLSRQRKEELAAEKGVKVANLTGADILAFEKETQNLAAAVEQAVQQVDLQPPETSVSAEALGARREAQAGQDITFVFTCNEPYCVYRCSLDASDFSPCPASHVLRPAPGDHTLTVFASDAIGNRDPTPATVTFAVLPPVQCGDSKCDAGETEAACPADCDKTAPETAFSSQPSAISNKNSTTFEFSCSDPVADRAPWRAPLRVGAASTPPSCSFFCQLDVGTPAPCVSPVTWSPVTDGLHTFAVYAVDAAGNRDPTPATLTWTVDMTAPETSISSQPSAVSQQASATFTFTCSEPSCTFECKLDSSAFSSCSSPMAHGSLLDGSHTFSVHAQDAAGNTDASPATFTWTISAQPSQPAAPSVGSMVINNGAAWANSLALTLNTAGASSDTAEMAITDGANCASGTYVAFGASTSFTLSAGNGTRTVSALYRTSAGGVSNCFTDTINMDTTPPTFGGISELSATSDSQVLLVWSVGSDNLTSQADLVYDICRTTTAGSCLSGFSATYTSSPNVGSYTAAGLTPGTTYYFTVRARDLAGNRDPNVVEKSRAYLSTVSSLAAGRSHACAVLTGGTARCWGLNPNGQLGNGGTNSSSLPVAVSSLSGISAMAAGDYHSCAVVGTGSVYCWGWNDSGQLGNGTSTGSSTPVAVSVVSNATAVAGSFGHSCALASDGSVKCWGSNENGKLGDGTSTPSTVPVAVTSLTGASAVATGGQFTCALLSNGAAKCWGANSSGQLGNGTFVGSLSPMAVTSLTGASAVAAGSLHACALLSGGTVKCWGGNSKGQLGDGTGSNTSTPVSVSGLAGASAIASGGSHACAVLAGGSAKCWGDNSSGQLGDGTMTDRSTPVASAAFSNAVSVAAGGGHTCARLADNTARCWGWNGDGQLGNGASRGSAVPVNVAGLAGASAVSGGRLHSCALLSTGAIQCWGDNFAGQIGDGTAGAQSTVVSAQGISNATAVASGREDTCAVLSDGAMKCWGGNTMGQLGNGGTTSSLTPATVPGLTGVSKAGAGQFTACAVLSSGSVKCWGWNSKGQLGDGTTSGSPSPVNVVGISTATAVDSGNAHSCALLSTGAVQCWGGGLNGQLGNGGTADSTTPVTVSSISNASAIAAGGPQTCAVLSTGAVQCWGWGGNLGNGQTTNSSTPVTVSSISTATGVGSGPMAHHTCALLSGGTVKCWGDGFYGQLGNGRTDDAYAPVAVNGITSATAVTTGEKHSCALLSGGAVQCWGDNVSGQLGSGFAPIGVYASPVPVISPP